MLGRGRRQPTDMRRCDHVLARGEARVGHLVGQASDIHRGAGEMPRIERRLQRGLIHQFAAREVDEEGPAPHGGKGRAIMICRVCGVARAWHTTMSAPPRTSARLWVASGAWGPQASTRIPSARATSAKRRAMRQKAVLAQAVTRRRAASPRQPGQPAADHGNRRAAALRLREGKALVLGEGIETSLSAENMARVSTWSKCRRRMSGGDPLPARLRLTPAWLLDHVRKICTQAKRYIFPRILFIFFS